MSEATGEFRDFGILPGPDLKPPAGPVRCYFSSGKLIGQFIFTGIVAAIGIGLMVLCALGLPSPLNLLGGVASLLAFSAIIFLATHNDYRAVELDGATLRATHLYTGRVVERTIDEIDCLGTMVYQVRQTATVVMEKLLGRVKGIEIRFQDGRTPMRITRADPAMTNAQQFIEGVLYRMSELGELTPQVVTFQGRPLVRSIHWKDRQPRTPPGKGLKVCLMSGAILALLFGSILGFWGAQERREFEIGALPLNRMTLAALIKSGPGANRHVEITDFAPGGYVVETQNNIWNEADVALFPAVWAEKRIPAVVTVRKVKNEAQLGQVLAQPIIGVCAAEPRSSWGTMGSELVNANQGRPLEAAWSIEEMREPPTEASVKTKFNGSLACFVAVWVLAGVILIKR